MIDDLIRRNRTFRRFYQEEMVSEATMRELVDLARLGASAANLQPLKYLTSADPVLNARIFPTLAWAGYLEDWPGPEEGERPAAYIVLLGDREISENVGCEQGIACQNILLGATERGLGGCIIGSVKREELRKVLLLPERFEILLVVALGRPKETVMIDPVDFGGSIKYWREADGTHHVPKRPLSEVLIDPQAR